MSLSVLTNIASLNAQHNLANTQEALAKSIGRLSSGQRINNAGDDAAGLGVSESLKSSIRSLAQAQRNANDAISMSQVGEGAMNEIQAMVSRMRELAIQAANSTLGSVERGYIHTEFQQLTSEINRVSQVTNFVNQKLLDGTASAGLTFQVGIFNTADDRLSLSITRITASTLGSATLHIASSSLSTATNAQNAIGAFDKAIQQLSTSRAKLGATQNRLTTTLSNISTSIENLTAANSRIRDVDVAAETAALTRYQILSQAGLAVLAQANQIPTSALTLLQ